MNVLNSNKLAFYTTPIFLFMGVVLSFTLFVIDLSPIYADLSDSPLFYGFSDFLNQSPIVNYLLFFIIFVSCAFLLYSINRKLFDNQKGGLELLLMYLFFSLSSLDSLVISSILLATPFIIISFYYTLFYGEESKNIFYSSFIFSVATLVNFKFVLIFPVLLFLLMLNRSDIKRDLVLFFIALISPYIIIFSIRYLIFFDFIDYFYFLRDLLIDINLNFIIFNNLIQLFLLICFVVILYSSMTLFLKSTSKLTGLSYITYVRSLTLLFSVLVPVFLYSSLIRDFFLMLFIPLSLTIFQFVYLNFNAGESNRLNYRSILFLILFIFLIFNRISLNL